MTENTVKVWKEADNTVEIIGTLVENNLELRQFDIYKDGVVTGEKRDAIAGDLVIRTGLNENQTVRLRQNAKTNAGADNRLYAGLVTIMNEAVSIADLEKNPELTASRLSVRGDMRLNDYYGQDGNLRSFPNLQGTFVNRLDADDKTEDKAEFDIEGMVGRVQDEVAQGEETGRKRVTLLVPMYNSVAPMDFIADAGDAANYIEDNFDNGVSVRIYGNIVNFREETQKEVEMGFGANKMETSVRFVNENNIKGGNLYEEGMHDAKIIDPEAVKEKLVERERYLETLKTRAEQRAAGGAGGKAKTGFGAIKKTADTPVDRKTGAKVNIEGMF